MSTEFGPIRKKRASLDATSPNPASQGDHRKRRRNRTTQSCLNCHTSKRMCDRKRPCGRCTQLGLTGLCVYEVDDPNQRSNAQDESSRLRQRVAELEGVIRELKNKPHPRWAKSGSSPGEEFEKCHARARSRYGSEELVMESQDRSDPSHSSTNSNIDPNEGFVIHKTPCLADETLRPDPLSLSFSPPSTASAAPFSALPCSPCPDTLSPPSAPSTGIVTPTEEHPQMQITVAGDQHLINDIDLASLFMPYPDLLGHDEGTGYIDRVFQGTPDQHGDPCSTKYRVTDGHCGCLSEAASYNVVLELSLRLRRAADVLKHSVYHRFNDGCSLNQRILDLDAFAMTVLGNTTTSFNDFGLAHLRSRVNTGPTDAIPPTFSAGGCIPVSVPVISSTSFRGVQSWNGMACTIEPSASCNESFITWEPSCRV